MSATNNNKAHYKTITLTCYIADIAYIFLRIFYLILFLICKLWILVWVDAATIVFYLGCLLLIKKRKYYLYALLCGNEFFAFIIVTTLMVGFASGFHLYLIGLCVVSFFTSYFSKQKNVKGSIIWAGLSLIIYLVLFFITENNDPHYLIDKWLEMTLFTTHIVLAFLFVVFYLVIFLKYALSLESKITKESRTDELTQINNRYALRDYFKVLQDKSSKALALFDIDNFKKVNDTYGHITGDVILKKVAETALKAFQNDFVCRYGGEEFVIVLQEKGAFEELEKFRKSIEEETFFYEGKSFNITITIGVHNYEDGSSLGHWVDLADEKMYSGKKTGKNKTVI